MHLKIHKIFNIYILRKNIYLTVNMKKIKNILYIHGYASKGHTGEAMEKLFKENFGITVYHPQFSPYYDKAQIEIDEFLKTHDIDLIIGTSLGGFMALNNPGYFRIAVNPVLDPYVTLPKIGVPKDIVDTYEIAGLDIPKDIFSTKIFVYGLFGGKDTVVDYKDEFSRIYDYNKMFFAPEMEHSMSDNDIVRYLFNVVKTVDEAKYEYDEFRMKHRKY